jgi:deoxyribonuclease V
MTTGPIACIDVAYPSAGGVAACVLTADWTSAEPVARHVVRVDAVAAYVPGRFYERELPCIRAVLEQVCVPLGAVIVDGYVWLDDRGAKGLGAHLFEALGRSLPVVGVAKTAFRGSAFAEPVLRGGSARPLYVTAAGMDVAEAARRVLAMHGAHRIPTLLRLVDRLCRAPA